MKSKQTKVEKVDKRKSAKSRLKSGVGFGMSGASTISGGFSSVSTFHEKKLDAVDAPAISNEPFQVTGKTATELAQIEERLLSGKCRGAGPMSSKQAIAHLDKLMHETAEEHHLDVS